MRRPPRCHLCRAPRAGRCCPPPLPLRTPEILKPKRRRFNCLNTCHTIFLLNIPTQENLKDLGLRTVESTPRFLRFAHNGLATHPLEPSRSL
ncbi:hypothetical protein NQ318_018361 [Aromia moschata]|uniref:Uncharacterized protein n=1 Tax=Aromia moschata TaxID=1265417 RepID=A0AAV8ZG78_9CUCU|nr:hypothetical protein NQ318_018361 [Aromia moschata]